MLRQHPHAHTDTSVSLWSRFTEWKPLDQKHTFLKILDTHKTAFQKVCTYSHDSIFSAWRHCLSLSFFFFNSPSCGRGIYKHFL